MIHLILGGARSGKSSHAESLVGFLSKKSTERHLETQITYIATAAAKDNEMRDRIIHHQEQRPPEWSLREEQYFIADIIKQLDSPQDIILIDCMTLWLSNWLCQESDTDLLDSWTSEKISFLNAIAVSNASIYIVSNEVGSGIIPLGTLTRKFVEQSGWLNQEIAKLADKATLVVAGIAMNLKGTNASDEVSSYED